MIVENIATSFLKCIEELKEEDTNREHAERILEL